MDESEHKCSESSKDRITITLAALRSHLGAIERGETTLQPSSYSCKLHSQLLQLSLGAPMRLRCCTQFSLQSGYLCFEPVCQLLTLRGIRIALGLVRHQD